MQDFLKHLLLLCELVYVIWYGDIFWQASSEAGETLSEVYKFKLCDVYMYMDIRVP